MLLYSNMLTSCGYFKGKTLLCQMASVPLVLLAQSYLNLSIPYLSNHLQRR
jgi:hypothetical protein